MTAYAARLINDGIEKGVAKEIFSSVQEGDYSVERGAEKLNISVEEFLRRMEEAGYTVPTMV